MKKLLVYSATNKTDQLFGKHWVAMCNISNQSYNRPKYPSLVK